MAQTALTPDSMLRERDLLAHIPFSRTHLWRLAREGRFPAPVRLTPRVVAWKWGDVQEWLEARRTADAFRPDEAA